MDPQDALNVKGTRSRPVPRAAANGLILGAILTLQHRQADRDEGGRKGSRDDGKVVLLTRVGLELLIRVPGCMYGHTRYVGNVRLAISSLSREA